MTRFSLLALFIIVCIPAFAQRSTHEINGIPVILDRFQIVVPLQPAESERKAAEELQHYLKLITGFLIPVVDESFKMKTGEFVIGLTNRAAEPKDISSLSPDGFLIQTRGQQVHIAGGVHKGSLYGVYELLEKYLGCRFWAPGEEFIPQEPVNIPPLNVRSEPAFASREVYYAGMDDQDFTDKMRSDRHAWKGGEDWGMWVHTMFSLVPPDKYFKAHPEYYALMDHKRVQTQLCLSNPDVLKITIEELGRRMKEKPEKRYWSVSQMDTFGACECDACRGQQHPDGAPQPRQGGTTPSGAPQPRQGGTTPSGSMIRFVNQVAAAFPDKVISTLAYQYTRHAPVDVKPASNVNIMLCTIECDRSKPLESDTSASSFVRDLSDWAAISDDILVWDYVIQFTNMLAPFPNLPVLQPNLQLFHKYGVKAVFEQGCHGTCSENQELRQYMLAKLLWNPYLDADSLRDQFLVGYYGAAGPFIGEYLRHMERALQQSGETLWIYSSPMQETGSFLSPGDIQRYNELFDQAEVSVGQDSTLIRRVKKARLPLRYAILEIAKKNITGPDGFLEQKGDEMVVKPEMISQLHSFTAQANVYGVKTLHERNLPPDTYEKNTLQYLRNAYSKHLAHAMPYVLASEPSPKYAAEGKGSLTDGKRGSPNYFVLWQGFEGVDFQAVIDLGEQKIINYVGAEFLQDLASWIFYPSGLVVSVSEDGIAYKDVAVFDSLSSTEPLLISETGRIIPETMTRFVRFTATGQKTCPGWHIGHGGKAWLFTDELIVDHR